MKLSKLKEIVLEVLQETNEQSATDGAGGYSTPYAFGKKGKKNRATKYGEKLGYTTVKTKKRPYNTKMFDYLDENDTRKI